MTEETRAELRQRLTTLVTLAGVPGAEIIDAEPRSFKFRDVPTGHAACAVVFPLGPGGSVNPPPLTTAQQLALSVLLGEPDAVVLSALCDCLIEMGHEYAVAVAENARREAIELTAGGVACGVSDEFGRAVHRMHSRD